MDATVCVARSWQAWNRQYLGVPVRTTYAEHSIEPDKKVNPETAEIVESLVPLDSSNDE
ncbi:hypothetical protein [Georgenia sp. 311]|uniref:hypothetical protein n=1 Tax=Georgenia sp. 311 TaxID=2585134 RepID=UPI00159BB717|nr:hypothetical protein [Georgenia sp. 311]